MIFIAWFFESIQDILIKISYALRNLSKPLSLKILLKITLTIFLDSPFPALSIQKSVNNNRIKKHTPTGTEFPEIFIKFRVRALNLNDCRKDNFFYSSNFILHFSIYFESRLRIPVSKEKV